MRIHAEVFLLSFSVIAYASFAEVPTTQGNRVIGMAFGDRILSADVGLVGSADLNVRTDLQNPPERPLLQRIADTFGNPAIKSFAESEHIEATDNELAESMNRLRELDKLWLPRLEKMLKRTDEVLALERIPADERAALEREKAGYARKIEDLKRRESSDQLEKDARADVIQWKVEQELYRRFGGKVVHHLGYQAIDARRKLFEQAERDGNLIFYDAGVRRLFYAHFELPYKSADPRQLER